MSNEFCLLLLEGLFTLIAALLTAWFAIYFYHKQKEYELVKQRYLDGAIDVIASEIDVSLGVFNHNWARCLNILKSFRDNEDNFDINDLNIGFIDYQSTNFNQVAHNRLHNLTGTLAYWDVYQQVMAFVTSNVELMQHEITDTIKAKITTDSINADRKKIVKDAFELLHKIQKESHEFAYLSEELQAIASLLEQEKLSIKKVKTFKDKKEVIHSISNIKSRYKDYLTKEKDA